MCGGTHPCSAGGGGGVYMLGVVGRGRAGIGGRAWSRHFNIERVRIIVLNLAEKGSILLKFACLRFSSKRVPFWPKYSHFGKKGGPFSAYFLNQE